jgi:ribosome-binding factor A
MANSTRSAKLADRIKVVVAETLKTKIKDPRLGFVTITDTRITGDLREATVFYTVFGDEEERAATAAALESAKGILRSEVGRQTGVKFTPSLVFILDAIPDGARQIDDLLAKAAAEDARVREIAQGKDFAGEADPYRVQRDLDEEDDEDEAGEVAAAAPEAEGTAGEAER